MAATDSFPSGNDVDIRHDHCQFGLASLAQSRHRNGRRHRCRPYSEYDHNQWQW